MTKDQRRAMDQARAITDQNIDTSYLRAKLERKIAAALLRARADGLLELGSPPIQSGLEATGQRDNRANRLRQEGDELEAQSG